MSEFRKRADGAIVSESELRAAFPRTSLPNLLDKATLDGLGYDPVLAAPMPQASATQRVVRHGAVLDSLGNWVQAWRVEDFSAQEVAALVESTRAALVERVTDARWRHEEGGLLLANGVRVATTRADQNRITSVVANAALAGVESVDFKAESGWTTLTIEDLRGVAAAIAQHVQACFSAERAHHEAVARLVTLEQMAAYDVTAGWPA